MMQSFTPREVEIYLSGMKRAERTAQRVQRGASSAQVYAIRQDRAKLALLAEQGGISRVREPLTNPSQPLRAAFSVLCEFLGVVMFFAMMYGIWMVGYAITGEPL